MSGPSLAPPDLCSIRASAAQEELAEAVRSGFSADGDLPGDDAPPSPRRASSTAHIPAVRYGGKAGCQDGGGHPELAGRPAALGRRCRHGS